MTFKEYGGLDLVKVADEVLQEWKKNGAFEKSLELREGAPEFIFFEGPPSANGMPGIHHVMARSIKDAVCRYKTQTGYKVRRRAGWDTHGLPVELGVEKNYLCMFQITSVDTGYSTGKIIKGCVPRRGALVSRAPSNWKELKYAADDYGDVGGFDIDAAMEEKRREMN